MTRYAIELRKKADALTRMGLDERFNGEITAFGGFNSIYFAAAENVLNLIAEIRGYVSWDELCVDRAHKTPSFYHDTQGRRVAFKPDYIDEDELMEQIEDDLESFPFE